MGIKCESDMAGKPRGSEELQHTADWSLRVWAGDLSALFEEAARGLNELAGVKPSGGKRVKRHFETEAPDAESLLVAFLSELIYYQEQQHIGFSIFDIRIFDMPNNEYRISADMEGAPIRSIGKPIKAVTYHNLKIEKTARGLEAEIVFDV